MNRFMAAAQAADEESDPNNAVIAVRRGSE
jgi:hypothetical protein